MEDEVRLRIRNAGVFPERAQCVGRPLRGDGDELGADPREGPFAARTGVEERVALRRWQTARLEADEDLARRD